MIGRAARRVSKDMRTRLGSYTRFLAKGVNKGAASLFGTLILSGGQHVCTASFLKGANLKGCDCGGLHGASEFIVDGGATLPTASEFKAAAKKSHGGTDAIFNMRAKAYGEYETARTGSVVTWDKAFDDGYDAWMKR